MFEDFVPVLRFAVMSDIHMYGGDCPQKERFYKGMREALAYCEGSRTYKGLDALAVVGDFTNHGDTAQMENFKSCLDECVPKDTKVILTLASHEFFREGGEAKALAEFDRIYGQAPDTHTVINDFHFIAITTTNGCSFDDKKIAWLSSQLEEAASVNRRRPIFVFQHPHISGTVYGSIFWGEKELYPVMTDYPQIIDFSGHSHAPINDPRSIHQKYFTSVGTGTLLHFELDEFDKICGTFPPDKEKAAQFLIVEASSDNRVRILRYDIISGKFFYPTLRIDTPSEPSSFLYTDARYKTTVCPYFPIDAEVNADVKAPGSVSISFTQARMRDERVCAYRVIVRSSVTGSIVRQRSIWSGYYLYDMPERLNVDIDGLVPGREYFAEVWADSFWNTSCENPLEISFRA